MAYKSNLKEHKARLYGSCCCNCGNNTLITTEPVSTCICPDCTKKTGRKLKYYNKTGKIIEIKPVIWDTRKENLNE